MAFGRINVTEIRKEVAKSRILDQAATRIIQDKFLASKDLMLEQFENHPVSKEIMEGPDGDNITNTLANYTGAVHGNLFAFLGFDKDEENPVESLKVLLEESIRLNTIPVKNVSGEGIHYRFVGRIPTLEEIKSATPLPWGGDGTSRSWVAIIEEGTNTFSYYLYKLYSMNNPPSRSGRAIQAKKRDGTLIQVHQGNFITTPYTSEILQKFVENVGSTNFRNTF
jgi:hypothetical protein